MSYVGNVKTEGVVEKIVFFNDENQFCIAQLKLTQKGSEFDKPITIAGILAGVQCGETLSLEGEWANHPTHGLQIKVKNFKTKLPSSVYGIVKYLGSGMIAGIGKTYAKAIVDKFGEDTLRIIETESARLREVEGIGEKRAREIKKSWDEQRGLRDVIMFLRTYGVGVAMCTKIVRRYGADAPRVIREEPYRMAREINGIGFKTADAVALNCGIPNESRQRIEAGVLFCIEEAQEDGHTCIDRSELERKAAEILQVDYGKCTHAIVTLIEEGEIVPAPNGLLQGKFLSIDENSIAKNLHRLGFAKSLLPPIIHDKALEWAKARAGFEFAPAQSEAILSALKSKVSVITGGPGTGKTTILKSVCDILSAKKCTPLLAAPTGRAAQRMSESAGVPAKTIHRLLGFDGNTGKFLHNKDNRLKAKFVVIDEASMLDTRLAAAVFSALPDSAHLLLVGDINQLPSVGAGNVLKDVIASKAFPVAELNEIFRQSSRSQIVITAHEILHGIDAFTAFSPAPLSRIDPMADINFVEALEPEECVGACVRLIKDIIPHIYSGVDPLLDVQLLAPMHKGTAGIAAFNHALQNALNPRGEGVSSGFAILREGDKVMQTRNNYDLDIYNGDLGKIVKIASDSRSLIVNFDGKKVEIERGDFGDLNPAYAISVHKSQGSEFPIVVLPLLKQHFMMLQRNLLYTGLTRGRRKVFIVGDPYAWKMAVKNAKSLQRNTALKERLV